MTKQYTIPIEGIPEGWEATKVTINNREICGTYFAVVSAIVELRKTKPREITLVETDEDHITRDMQIFKDGDVSITFNATKIWRIKDEQ